MRNFFKDEELYGIYRRRRRSQFGKMESILKEWYGEEKGAIENISHLPNAVPIQSGIEKVLEKSFGKGHAILAKLNQNWPSIVGPQISKVSRPMSLNGGLLIIEVDGSAWLMELKNYSSKMIENKIVELFGNKPYKKLIFSASNRRYTPKK